MSKWNWLWKVWENPLEWQIINCSYLKKNCRKPLWMKCDYFKKKKTKNATDVALLY